MGNILCRGVQAAEAEILSHVYEQDFQSCSFGFRPNKNCHQALKLEIAKRTEDYILEIDLENFFGTLDHGWILKFLQIRVKDRKILELTKSWLKAGIIEKEKLRPP